MIEFHVATLCVGIALFLDTASQYRQIRKTLRTRKSSQISSTAFLYKISKVFFSITGLMIYQNFVGASMEAFMLVVYIIALSVVIRYKPKNWRLF